MAAAQRMHLTAAIGKVGSSLEKYVEVTTMQLPSATVKKTSSGRLNMRFSLESGCIPDYLVKKKG